MTNITQLEEIVRQSKIGTVVPVYKSRKIEISPLDYFAKLSDYGRKKNSILLESAEVIPKYGEQSVGTSDPCLKLMGRAESFSIKALNETGVRFLQHVKGRLNFCDELNVSDQEIKGILRPQRKVVSEAERLNLKTHMDIIRTVGFAFSPTLKPVNHYGGLFGIFSYDFIDQFEDLPPNRGDLTNDPDYEIFFADNVFVYDHSAKSLNFIANALITDENSDATFKKCLEKIAEFEGVLDAPLPLARKYIPKKGKISSDTSKESFIETVEKLKEHIGRGDIFQAVLSRNTIMDYNSEPLDIYRELRESNPSPYMFFINNETGLLIGASPERCIGVKEENGRRIVEIRPIAGTKPRGIINGVVNTDLDGRYESELKLDPKELAEHTMLIDLARNDVARVSEPGTRHVVDPYTVEKYSHVQHLVSKVTGVLKREYDPLHAYLASMNMGTLTGAPKLEAMKLLRRYEENRRGFYGGAVFYMTPSKDFDSAIIIRSMRIRGDKAYIRAGAGVVQDSVPEKEYDETERKAAACIKAVKGAGGITYD